LMSSQLPSAYSKRIEVTAGWRDVAGSLMRK
jgi:hypothetical protein